MPHLVVYELLDSEAVLGGNHTLVQLLEGSVVAAKWSEHSVEYGPHIVNLVALVHGLICLIDQVQETPEVLFHDFPETWGAHK